MTVQSIHYSWFDVDFASCRNPDYIASEQTWSDLGLEKANKFDSIMKGVNNELVFISKILGLYVQMKDLKYAVMVKI